MRNPFPPDPSIVNTLLAEGVPIDTANSDAPTQTAKLPPNQLAEQILRHHYFIRFDKSIYRYTGTHWTRCDEGYIRNIALHYDGPHHSTRNRRNEIAHFITDSRTSPSQPPWRSIRLTEVPFLNGVVDVLTGEVRPHRREDFLESVLPHDYTPGAACPAWLDALNLYFGQDADCEAKIDALQEFFGYVLLPHARFKKALVLHGDSDTGKSQPINILREMVGRGNYCSVPVEDMDDARKRVPLIGKMLNCLTELTSRATIADGGFKNLVSTEESLQFDPKYESPFDYTPFAKHVFACNELPSINDRSRATFGRLLLIRFNHEILHKDRSIIDRLRAELPGITAWALEGAARLTENNGDFTHIPESEHQIQEYRESQNDVHAFVEERCTIDPDDFVLAKDFYDKFRNWSNNPKHTRYVVSKLCNAAGFPVRPQHVPELGKSARIVKGLRWAN